MSIRLTHQLHGVKDCYVESEAYADIANGWIRVVAADETKVEANIELLKTPSASSFSDAKPKRGRPFKAK